MSADRIRILHVIGSLETGGQQQYLRRIANRLDPKRFDQWVIYPEGGPIEQEFAEHVELVYAPIRGSRVSRALRLYRYISESVHRKKIDVVATHSAGYVQIFTALAGRRAGARVIHTIQRPYGNRSRTEDWVIRTPGLRHLVYGAVDVFVALGSYYQTEQASLWKIPERKIQLNYIGVDLSEYAQATDHGTSLRREFGIAPDSPVLGIVARLHWVKGIDRGLDALKRILTYQPDTKLVVVGGGPEEEALKDRVGETGLDGAVRFLRERTDVPRLLGGFDALLQTTRNPLNGIVSIEAMAAGLPIVTVVDRKKEEEMARDTCVEEVNGLYYRLWEPETSARAVSRLLGDHALRSEMGRMSRKLAVERFDLKEHVRRLERLYSSEVDKARPAAAGGR